MTATRAVANLHVHLEYDSELDVITAAMAEVSEGGSAGDRREERTGDRFGLGRECERLG